MPPLITPFQHHTVRSNAIRQEKENKHILMCAVGLRNTVTICVMEHIFVSRYVLYLELRPSLLPEEQTEVQKDGITCPKAHN